MQSVQPATSHEPRTAPRRPVIRFFVPGILTLPGESGNWTGRAVTWTHIHTGDRAEKVEYFSGIFTRTLLQRLRAQKMAKALSDYLAAGFEIHIAAHSNGTDVVLDALRLAKWPRIASLHLLSAACSADCHKNGLNEAWTFDALGQVTVWIAEHDWALGLASTAVGWALGFGTLGRTGPLHALFPIDTRRAPLGHSGWFEQDNFDHTMSLLTA